MNHINTNERKGAIPHYRMIDRNRKITMKMSH